ncbi:DUF3251 domain-containing protein, partial [Serratia ureilytica]|uniref:DUF3251 domain-containing protein n=1 Tax=Serratia ureilytica TaxID=300181 RepID=UPI0019D0B5C2
MTTRYPKIALLAAAVLLTGCAHNAAVPQLRHQVAALNQKVSVLTDQATALERQNQLNQHSDNGVYLLPGGGGGPPGGKAQGGRRGWGG